jgi:signal transduction histidine kinase
MTTERIGSILQSVSQRVGDLIPSDRFYVILYDQNKNEFSFPLVRHNGMIVSDGKAPWLNRLMHSENCLPDWIVATGESFLVEKGLSSQLQEQKMGYWPNDTVPYSWLGVPLTIGGQVSGALIFENWQESKTFDNNKLQVLYTVARQTANAIENAQIKGQLERKIKHLQTLNRVGQQLTKGLVKKEQEILELIQQSVTRLDVDARNMSVAFYEPGTSDNGEDDSGQLRFVLAYEDGRSVHIPDRQAGKGLITHVIRSRASFNPAKVEQTYMDLAEEQSDRIPLSWLGVPMISSDGQVFGVIILENHEVEGAYDQDDQEILELLANQAAVALQVQREQQKKIEMERVFSMGTMAAEFAHKMNNMAGTIPVRVDLVRQELRLDQPNKEEIHNQLGKIDTEVKNLLNGAQEIRKAIKLGETGAAEDVSIGELIETAIARARNTRINLEADVESSSTIKEALPVLRIDRNALLDTLTNIIKNGFEAIPKKGTVDVHARTVVLDRRTWIEINIIDTGKGIPASELTKIFDLFFTTKGESGLGFGLWRDKVFIKKFGGEIDVNSRENHGSTFTIRLPVTNRIPTTNEK